MLLDEQRIKENAACERLLLAHLEWLVAAGLVAEKSARDLRMYLTNASKTIRVYRNEAQP